MNIYNELKRDHDQVQSLLSKLSEAEAPEARRELIARIRDLLVPHSRAEEAVFYNTLRDLDEGKGLITHSYQEHLKAETLLRGLEVTEAIALNWKAGVEKLKEEINHHIQEEEGKVFRAAQKVFSDEDAIALGKAFKKLKPEVGTSLLSSNLELVKNLLPQRFRESFAERIPAAETEAKKKAS